MFVGGGTTEPGSETFRIFSVLLPFQFLKNKK